MTFARIKSVGWATDEELTSAQMNALDIDHSKAVDGADGGSYDGPLVLGDVTAKAGTKYKLSSRSLTRTIAPHLFQFGPPLTNWSFTSTPDGAVPTTTGVGTDSLLYPIEVPNGCTLTAINFYMVGGSGHGGSLPGTKPKITLYENDPAAGTGTLVSTRTDPSADGAAFEAVHVIDLTGLTQVIDRVAKSYWLLVETEHGSNAQAGAKFFGPLVTFTTTAMDDGGC